MPNAETILEALADNRGWTHYALRVTHADVRVAEGDTLAPSRVWIEGDPTDETLPGTSGVEIRGATERLVEHSLRRLADYISLGGQVVLVGSDDATEGTDNDEIVLVNAMALAVWEISE